MLFFQTYLLFNASEEKCCSGMIQKEQLRFTKVEIGQKDTIQHKKKKKKNPYLSVYNFLIAGFQRPKSLEKLTFIPSISLWVFDRARLLSCSRF